MKGTGGGLEHSVAAELATLVATQEGAIVSRTLVDRPAGTLTLFAFGEGQGLSEHQAPYDAIVQVVEGTAELTIGGRPVAAPAGSIVIMPANVPHAVRARTAFKMLLTMIRG